MGCSMLLLYNCVLLYEEASVLQRIYYIKLGTKLWIITAVQLITLYERVVVRF